MVFCVWLLVVVRILVQLIPLNVLGEWHWFRVVIQRTRVSHNPIKLGTKQLLSLQFLFFTAM